MGLLKYKVLFIKWLLVLMFIFFCVMKYKKLVRFLVVGNKNVIWKSFVLCGEVWWLFFNKCNVRVWLLVLIDNMVVLLLEFLMDSFKMFL